MPRFVQTSPLGRLIDGVSNWRRARETHRVLSSLTDYELDDIGLTRADVERFGR